MYLMLFISFSFSFFPWIVFFFDKIPLNIYIYFLRILNIFSTHTRGEGEGLKETYSDVYPKESTLEYTAQALNLFNSHSFSNVGITYYFFVWEY